MKTTTFTFLLLLIAVFGSVSCSDNGDEPDGPMVKWVPFDPASRVPGPAGRLTVTFGASQAVLDNHDITLVNWIYSTPFRTPLTADSMHYRLEGDDVPEGLTRCYRLTSSFSKYPFDTRIDFMVTPRQQTYDADAHADIQAYLHLAFEADNGYSWSRTLHVQDSRGVAASRAVTYTRPLNLLNLPGFIVSYDAAADTFAVTEMKR